MSASLAASEYGTGEPVVILHGLFGSGRNWAGIAQRLGAHRHVIAFDLRNHGASPWFDMMSYRAMAEDVLTAMATRGHRRYTLIGHSMGGKVAMTMALTAPGTITRLLVVDIAPVTYGVLPLDYVRAMRALDLGALTRRRDADEALTAAIPDVAERAFLLQNLDFAAQPPRWRLNLAALEAAMPTLGAFPDIAPGTVYTGSTLFIGGSRSDMLRSQHKAAIRVLFPNAELVWIPDAGHWVHAERPEAFLALAERFLAR